MVDLPLLFGENAKSLTEMAVHRPFVSAVSGSLLILMGPGVVYVEPKFQFIWTKIGRSPRVGPISKRQNSTKCVYIQDHNPTPAGHMQAIVVLYEGKQLKCSLPSKTDNCRLVFIPSWNSCGSLLAERCASTAGNLYFVTENKNVCLGSFRKTMDIHENHTLFDMARKKRRNIFK